MNPLKFFFSIFCICTLYSCANIRQPTGGPIDQEPPQLTQAIPTKNTVNFKGNTITFIFNEPIAANNLSQNLFITPQPEEEITTSIRNRQLIINFPGKLQESTTYTIFLKDAVKDITEGNLLKSEIYTFSTGSFIDSLAITGTIRELETNKPVPNAVVGLYQPDKDTIQPKISKPYYFTITDDKGSFLLPNLKQGEYDAYAFVDANRNFLYDPEKEKIGFKKNISLNNTIRGLNIGIGSFDDVPPRITSQKADSLTHTIQFSEGITNVTINPDIHIAITQPTQLTAYRPDYYKDTITSIISVADSAGNVLNDTIPIYFSESNLLFSPSDNLLKEIKPTTRKLNPVKDSISLLFSVPIRTYKPELLVLQGVVNKNVTTIWNSFNNILTINNIKIERDTVVLILQKGAFTDIFGRENREDTILFTKQTEVSTGLISGTVATTVDNYVLELLDDKYKVIERRKSPKSFTFNYLNPGTYYIRTFIDRNNNGKLDKGDPRTDEDPEKVIFYPEPIKLRANWELTGLDVKVD